MASDDVAKVKLDLHSICTLSGSFRGLLSAIRITSAC